MRTATRIALVLTGTAIFIAAMATPGARADLGQPDAHAAEFTARQRALPQPQPGRIDYVRGAKVVSVATAIAHLSTPPEVANADRGVRWAERAVALADTIGETTDKPISSSSACNRGTFASQQRNASDGGRGPVAESEQPSCREDHKHEPRMRKVAVGDLDLSQMQSAEPAPVLLKFEAVIKIDLAGLAW